jgi:hypothetical protein
MNIYPVDFQRRAEQRGPVVLSCRAHPRPCRIFACSPSIVCLSRNPMSSVMAPRPVARC